MGAVTKSHEDSEYHDITCQSLIVKACGRFLDDQNVPDNQCNKSKQEET